jgi:hypothetical protein
MVGLIFGAAQSVPAVERLGYIGQSFTFPLFLSDPQSYDDLTYNLDMGYFLHESVSVSLSINTQVDGMQLFYLEFGPQYYPLHDVFFMPYFSARLLYTMVPNGTAGWIADMGIEAQLSRSHDAENFRVRIGTGAGQFFFDNEYMMFVQLARVGLIWSF